MIIYQAKSLLNCAVQLFICSARANTSTVWHANLDCLNGLYLSDKLILK